MSNTAPTNKPIAKRVLRSLTPREQQRLDKARKEAAEAKQAIVAEAKLRKAAAEAVAVELTKLLEAIRARREQLDLSLAELEARTGIKRSALSRLDNGAEDANPTLLTLQRYALALGMTIHLSIRPL